MLRTPVRALQDVPQLVVVPRKPERFAEVAAMIERRGLRCVRRTVSPDGTDRSPLTSEDVVLGDTMGELRKFYSLCSVAFVGRSLVPMGGSDTMEVAALGKPMIVGPHNENFRNAFDVFQSAGVLTVVDSAKTMADAVVDWLSDRQRLLWKSDCAKRSVEGQQGATVETADALVRLLRA
jgi:3-deoxy-D-manno-octulosonic-acid transferase